MKNSGLISRPSLLAVMLCAAALSYSSVANAQVCHLCDLAYAGNSTEIRRRCEAADASALAQGRDSQTGRTAVLMAARGNHTSLVEDLLDGIENCRGVDPHSPNSRGRTPLMWAAQNGNVEMGTELIETAAENSGRLTVTFDHFVNAAKTNDNRNAADIARDNNQTEFLVSLIVRANGVFNNDGVFSGSHVINVLGSGDMDRSVAANVARAILEAGNINPAYGGQDNLFNWSVVNGEGGVSENLIRDIAPAVSSDDASHFGSFVEDNQDFDSIDDAFSHAAVEEGDGNLVRVFVAMSVSNDTAMAGFFEDAVRRGHVSVLSVFVEDADAANFEFSNPPYRSTTAFFWPYRTAIIWSHVNNDFSAVQFFLDNGVDVHSFAIFEPLPDKHLYVTGLDSAMWRGLPAVRFLLSRMDEASFSSDIYQMVLSSAAHVRSLSIVEELLDRGFDPDRTGFELYTGLVQPLHYANYQIDRSSASDIVTALLDGGEGRDGADMFSEDSDLGPPFVYALRYARSSDVIDAYLDHPQALLEDETKFQKAIFTISEDVLLRRRSAHDARIMNNLSVFVNNSNIDVDCNFTIQPSGNFFADWARNIINGYDQDLPTDISDFDRIMETCSGWDLSSYGPGVLGASGASGASGELIGSWPHYDEIDFDEVYRFLEEMEQEME